MPSNTGHLIRGRQRDKFPGDEVYVLSHKATDRNGREWEAGTEYTPLNAGRDNERNCDYQLVAIKGMHIVFESDRGMAS